MSILVLFPEGSLPAELPAVVEAVAYAGADGLANGLARDFAAAVLVSDGLLADDLEQAAEAVRGCGRPVIEVRSERWDGATSSPLSAACRGVISGFGPAGVQAAVALARGLA